MHRPERVLLADAMRGARGQPAGPQCIERDEAKPGAAALDPFALEPGRCNLLVTSTLGEDPVLYRGVVSPR